MPPTRRSSSFSRSGQTRARPRTCASPGNVPTSRPCSPAPTPAGSRSRSTGLSSRARSSSRTSREHGIREMVRCSPSRRRPRRQPWPSRPPPASSWRERAAAVQRPPWSLRGTAGDDRSRPGGSIRRRPRSRRGVDGRVLAASAAIHDEATPAARGVDQIVPGADEATLASRGIGTEPAVSPGHGEASTASSLASIAGIHDEATPAARGVGQTVPGADEATLAARGIEAPVAQRRGDARGPRHRDARAGRVEHGLRVAVARLRRCGRHRRARRCGVADPGCRICGPAPGRETPRRTIRAEGRRKAVLLLRPSIGGCRCAWRARGSSGGSPRTPRGFGRSRPRRT